MPADLPIRLLLTLCFGAPHCVYSRPVFFPTWHACARAGEEMTAHAREVALGNISFRCAGVGGTPGVRLPLPPPAR